ncbi:dihydrodipicolinate reductase [Sulfitobacter sp. PS-8MA]|uniref:dihydrodipicolinate reductase n=1 Tax=Sulfitobacter sp. PS-8MA TaxID=3237707 RepID=UPI0034C6B122
MKPRLALVALTLSALCAAPAAADFARIQTKSDFLDAVTGKRLTRALVDLRVSPGGAISGTGAVWEVTGVWSWEGGYFCRTLVWGGKDLGYNCQTVSRDGAKIRFTSDKGAGESADFNLR